MLRRKLVPSVEQALRNYASGMGLSLAEVRREFRALSEEDRFKMLRAIKELEQKHQEYLARVAGEVAATGDNVLDAMERQPKESAPLSEGEQAAAKMRAEYLRTGQHPGRSALLDRFGRPMRRG